MDTAYLGPQYPDEEITGFLRESSIPFQRVEVADIPRTVAGLLAGGSVVGWFQGRMEFGPRALGGRSILASPIDPGMKDKINEKVKHREAFRPFAPTVLREKASEFFDFGGRTSEPESPFMLLVATVRPEKASVIPAVTHVDGTARVQTVSRDQNPLYYDVVHAFGRLTGVPVLVNTSFNVRGEPIVCTPREAFNTFSHTDLDHLMMGPALIPASSKRALDPYPGASTVHAGAEVIT